MCKVNMAQKAHLVHLFNMLFFVGARAAENSEIEVKLVHIFILLLCRGQEQVKSFVSMLSFSFQRINLSFLVV